MTPDLINGLFELGGALTLCLNVRALWRDRTIAGVHWGPIVFFTAWGCWNLFYYPNLHQWFSFAGGVAVVAVNFSWLVLLAWLMRDQIECPVDKRVRWSVLGLSLLSAALFLVALMERGRG